MITERTADFLIAFLDKYNRHFEDLADFLEKKQNKILLDDLKWLEKALVEEQSLIMQGNSLEERRLELFEKAGLKGKKFSELPEYFPKGYEGTLRLHHERLNKSVARIKKLTDTAADIVERKLKVQAKLLGVSDFTGIGAYSEDARIIKGKGGDNDIIGSV